MKCDYGQEYEMVCILIDQSSLPDFPENSSESEGQFVNGQHTKERDNFSITSVSSLNTSPRTSSSKGPMLRFKYVPQPPSRPTSRTKAPSPEKRRLITSTPKSTNRTGRKAKNSGSFNDTFEPIPSRIHLRAMSPGPQNNYGGFSRSRQSPLRSEHAASLFNVKSSDETPAHDEEKRKPLELYLSDIIAIDIMPDPVAVDVNLMYITTKTIGFLQLAFHKLLDQEILLAFLKASVSEGVISQHDDRFRKIRCAKIAESQENMDNFTARAVKQRFLNESVWERTKRRMARFATKASEVCYCSNIHEQYAYEERLNHDTICGQTVQTKMEQEDPDTLIKISGSEDNERNTNGMIEHRDETESGVPVGVR